MRQTFKNNVEGYERRIKGEPTAADAPADFDRQYEMLHRKLQDERCRADAIDAKTATLLAGTIALLGFALQGTTNKFEATALVLFMWPIYLFWRAYKPVVWKDAPNEEEIAEKFSWFPQTTIASAAQAIAESIRLNRPTIERKVDYLNSGLMRSLPPVYSS